jgi:hypothetical protein
MMMKGVVKLAKRRISNKNDANKKEKSVEHNTFNIPKIIVAAKWH